MSCNTIFFKLSLGNSTQDMYAVGDLSGKLENMNEIQWDIFLPLSGPNSVLHKTIAIYV